MGFILLYIPYHNTFNGKAQQITRKMGFYIDNPKRWDYSEKQEIPEDGMVIKNKKSYIKEFQKGAYKCYRNYIPK
jgi:hypothetical protein